MRRWIAFILTFLVLAWVPTQMVMAYPVSSTSGAGTITTTEILDGTVTADDIAAGAVGTSEILDNTITADDIAPGAVGTSEILDGTITGGDLSPAIAIATTGTISGKMVILDNVASPAGQQLYNTINLVDGNHTTMVTAAIAGMSICVVDNGATHDNVVFDVPGTDNIVLLGTTLAGGTGITNSGGTTVGDYVCLIALTANKWTVFGYQGTWASQ